MENMTPTRQTNPSSIEQMDNLDWDIVIKPRKKWFDLQLSDIWYYRDLITLFVRRDFVSRFKQTILGPLWFVIQPTLTSLVFTVIFGQIANLPTNDTPKFLFYLSGTVLWNYFSTCLTTTADTFVSNAGIFGKVYFPRLVIPISTVLSNLISFSIQFLFFLGFLAYYLIIGSNIHLTLWAFALPLLILLMAGFGLGFGIIITSMTTKYRDLRFIIGFGVSLWMYATPIIYPVSSIPQAWRWIADINPITPIIETFRVGFLGTGTVSCSGLLYASLLMILVLFIGITIFNQVENTFIDTI
ncbi:ABC transporter permease [bacterium]|nr:ABC transporter permease [bacterium]